jgi:glycolate oxidase subunit GlcD
VTRVARELAALVGEGGVIDGTAPEARPYLVDATESRAIQGRAEAIVLPDDARGIAAVLAWCYEHDVPLVPRGGGTGYAGGAVPLEGGVVLGVERLRDGVVVEPAHWRMWAPAGLRTAEVRRLARENGLLFPIDPGAAESSRLGGNIATNAGGPHSFKYGVTGAWVMGLEVALAPGEVVQLGGPVRKDVAGYDLRALLVGSEGTLGVVTGAWLRLVPAPEAALPVVARYPGSAAGCAAIARVFASGLQPATLEFLDELAVAVARPETPGFLVIAEADGTAAAARALSAELVEVLGDGALDVHAPRERSAVAALWRWREGVSLAVTAQRGGKLSEDIVVPVERLGEAVAGSREIAAAHGLATCAWGHAGDGNLHATFMIDRGDPDELARAEAAAQELFALAIRCGGSVSGEHGIGLVKRGALADQWPAAVVELHEAIKRLFDPKDLLNPGKKLARQAPAS